MGETAELVAVEGDRYFDGSQVHPNRLQHHLRRVLPGLRGEAHRQERVAVDAAHATVDVAERASVDSVQSPRRERCAEVAVRPRHCTLFDLASESRTHDHLISRSERLDERSQQAKVVGAVRVAHHDVATADVRDRVDVGPPETASRGPQALAPAARARAGGVVGRRVDDDDLSGRSSRREPLVTPADELGDRDLLVDGGDEDRHLRIRGVPLGNEQLDLGVHRAHAETATADRGRTRRGALGRAVVHSVPPAKVTGAEAGAAFVASVSRSGVTSVRPCTVRRY